MGLFEMRCYCSGLYGGDDITSFGHRIDWQKLMKVKIRHGLRRPPNDKKTTTTNQKHAGLTGERWDMRRNQQGARWERKLIILGRSSGDSVKTKIKSISNKKYYILSQRMILSQRQRASMPSRWEHHTLNGWDWEYDTLRACWEHHTLGAASWEYDTLGANQAAMGNAAGAMGGRTQINRVWWWDGGGMMDNTMSSEHQTR